MLPQDPKYGFVNARLRDQYASRDALCGGLDADSDQLIQTLAGPGYVYGGELNCFTAAPEP